MFEQRRRQTTTLSVKQEVRPQFFQETPPTVESVEQRVAFVQTRLDLEEMLLRKGRVLQSEFIEYIDALVNPISTEEVAKLWDMAERWNDRTDAVDKVEVELESQFQLDALDEHSMEWGEKLFRARTGRDPIGTVSFRRSGPFFTMFCDDLRDYTSAEAGIKKYDPTGGFPNSATFHNSMRIPFWVIGEFNIPVVLTRKEGMQEKGAIDVHEYQHFLNHGIYGLFSDTESKGKKITGVERKFRKLKDEVLACIRGNSFYIPFHVETPEYEHLFRMDMSHKREARQLLEQIRKALAASKNFRSSENRSLLIQYLLDIPLEDIPLWIPQIDAYLAQRGAVMATSTSVEPYV